MNDLNVTWHVPTQAQLHAVLDLLNAFLIPELRRFDRHVAGDKLDREELKLRLKIVNYVIQGAGCVLPLISGEPVKLYACLAATSDELKTRFRRLF